MVHYGDLLVLADYIKLRLVGGSSDDSQTSGRVEVLYNGVWGIVCDDEWDINDATVVRRQLGFALALEAVRYARYGQGTGPILLDNFHCTGEEDRLQYCPHNGWKISNCVHAEDAGVVCSSECVSIHVCVFVAHT